jgi:4-hydroxy 2-oxovalerate aldolase
MKKIWEWGYSLPYLLTGATEEHPRKAIAVRSSAYPDEYMALLEDLLTPRKV